MKTLICLMALSLTACPAKFEQAKTFDDKNPTEPQAGEAGTSEPPSAGGSGGMAQGGKAGAPSATGGTDSMAGAGDETSVGGSSAGKGSAGTGSAGKESGTGGMAGMPSSAGGSAGSGMAGSPSAGMGQGGSDSPMAGTGGTDSGVAGAGSSIDWCSASAHDANWADITWNSNVTGLCATQNNYIGKGLLTLKLPANCAWQYDPSSSDSWQGCRFTNSLSCTALGSVPAFTAQVSSQFMGTTGQLNGTLYYQSATAGACVSVSVVSFSGQRDI